MKDTIELKKEFCCPPLQDKMQEVGKRGVAILAYKTENEIRFLLQSRGIAAEDVKLFPPLPIEVRINISGETGIKFCPFCGRRLAELAQANPTAFESLAERHKVLLDHLPWLFSA